MRVRKLSPTAQVPKIAQPGDAAYDLYADADIVIPADGASYLVPTGISLEIPVGHVGKIWSRSSMARFGTRVDAGVIDSNYRGPIMVMLFNTGREDYAISRGDRIAQLCILPIATPEPILVEVLGATNRGEGGFGSTGK
jgi:deoxyuridine 5'-triphosphate nucleotidohydrolase